MPAARLASRCLFPPFRSTKGVTRKILSKQRTNARTGRHMKRCWLAFLSGCMCLYWLGVWRKAARRAAAVPRPRRPRDRAGPERRAAAAAVGRHRPDRRPSCGRRTTCRCAAPKRQGALRLIELGVATDADAFWFCLKPEVKKKRPALRVRAEAASSGRRSRTRSIARRSRETVFLGEAVPVWGPITPGNQPWF